MCDGCHKSLRFTFGYADPNIVSFALSNPVEDSAHHTDEPNHKHDSPYCLWFRHGSIHLYTFGAVTDAFELVFHD